MKKRTKAQKCKDYYDAFKAIREGRPVKRVGAKDGSIATRSIVPILALSEAAVLRECLRWLKQHKILCNRNNVGSGHIGESGFYSYGIRGAGDIVGLLKNGRHFEIECKRGKGGRLSLEQQKRMQDVRINNGVYLVIHGIKELESYFKDLL